jgi:hypothetical protein
MHPFRRHNRPLFGAGHVGGAGGHPDHVILVVQRLVILAVLAQARVVR